MSGSTVTLMQPTLLPRPFHREGWVYEEKYDGWRMLAYKDGDRVQLISRPGRDHTRRFPDLVAAIAALRPSTLILDGEVCIFDRQLVSRFEWLRHGKPVDVATPPMFMAFDCLHAAGRELRPLPLRARREWLEDLLTDQHLSLPARRLAGDGLEAWKQVLGNGYEGLVAKDPESRYVGGRTLKWLKVKQRGYRVEERGWDSKRCSASAPSPEDTRPVVGPRCGRCAVSCVALALELETVRVSCLTRSPAGSSPAPAAGSGKRRLCGQPPRSSGCTRGTSVRPASSTPSRSRSRRLMPRLGRSSR